MYNIYDLKLVSFKSASKWTLINLQCFNVLWFVFTLKVLFRCKHLLSSRNPSIRLLALDTIANSCRALQSHQGKQYVILELPLTVYLILAEQLCFERACISYKVSALSYFGYNFRWTSANDSWDLDAIFCQICGWRKTCH